MDQLVNWTYYMKVLCAGFCHIDFSMSVKNMLACYIPECSFSSFLPFMCTFSLFSCVEIITVPQYTWIDVLWFILSRVCKSNSNLIANYSLKLIKIIIKVGANETGRGLILKREGSMVPFKLHGQNWVKWSSSWHSWKSSDDIYRCPVSGNTAVKYVKDSVQQHGALSWNIGRKELLHQGGKKGTDKLQTILLSIFWT